MSALDAAHQALVEAGEPLHYTEIARRILDQGLWTSKGKTPAATVNARLAVDIKKHGAASRFRRAGRGIFELNPDPAAAETNEPAVRESEAQERRPIADATSSATRRRSSRRTTTMTFLDAAAYVLQHHSRRRPMHYRAITDVALERELVQTSGLTPDATMNAQLLTDIRRRQRRGEQPRFTKHGKGFYGLARWMGRGLAFDIERHNRRVRSALLKWLKAMDPADFEELIGQLLAELGFEEIEVTAASKDGGIDVRGMLVVGEVIKTRMAVQVKRWKGNVQAPTVQQVRGSLGTHEQGLIITTSDFSKGARAEAERPDAVPVGLMDGEQLVNLLAENEIGVRLEEHAILELDEGDEGRDSEVEHGL